MQGPLECPDRPFVCQSLLNLSFVLLVQGRGAPQGKPEGWARPVRVHWSSHYRKKPPLLTGEGAASCRRLRVRAYSVNLLISAISCAIYRWSADSKIFLHYFFFADKLLQLPRTAFSVNLPLSANCCAIYKWLAESEMFQQQFCFINKLLQLLKTPSSVFL